MITGQEKPDAGTITIGETVQARLCRPEPRSLDGRTRPSGRKSPAATTSSARQARDEQRAYCSSFNFKGGDQQQKVGNLSGGQRNRVHLAKMLKNGGNVLLLDEPTNDLDTETLAALEDALEDFAGCAVIISHDRMFLDRPGHAHPGLRRRQPCRMVRGQLRGLRGRQDPPTSGYSHVECFKGDLEGCEQDKRGRR
jgi:ATPase subunit of ABC transporter with duplicated ATPase domains